MTRRFAKPAGTPLLAWAERQQATKARPHLRRWTAAVLTGTGLIGLTVVAPPVPRLIWNASASAPIGLYWIEPGADIDVGDIAAAWPPLAARRLAAARGYLPAHVPLVKAVGAVAGDDVCAFGQEILINGMQAGDRQLADRRGRPMPAWNGCLRLRGRALFLFNRSNRQAFDGRYFGITGRSEIIGKAHLLWAR